MPRYYCGQISRSAIESVTGVRATITTTPPVNLPDDPGFTASAVFAGVKTNEGGYLRWAQMGYATWRDPESDTGGYNLYTEVQYGPADDDYYRRYFEVPAGEQHLYSLVLDFTIGQWRFYLDGEELDRFSNDGWVDLTTLEPQFTGEVTAQNVPVVGSDDEPCDLEGCAIRIGGSFTSCNFEDEDQWAVVDHETPDVGVGQVRPFDGQPDAFSISPT